MKILFDPLDIVESNHAQRITYLDEVYNVLHNIKDLLFNMTDEDYDICGVKPEDKASELADVLLNVVCNTDIPNDLIY